VLLPFVIAGLTTGAVYALAGVGLVLTYKTSGVFNFGHGALATLSAYLFYTLHVESGLPWELAAALCVFVAGPLLGIVIERLSRRLATADLSARVASTVGLLLVIEAAAVIVYGQTETRTVPVFLPHQAFHLAGTVVTMDRVIIFAVATIVTLALFVYFRTARTGLAMRAVVDDPSLLDMAGTNPVAVRRWAWMLGSSMAAASGVLLVPFLTLDATTLTFLVVAAFGAAAIGRFSNLPLTYLGGLAIGVGAALCTKYFTSGLLSGLSASLPFVVLFVVLLVTPRRRLAERIRAIPAQSSGWTTPWPLQTIVGLGVLVFLCFVPGFAGIHLADFSGFLSLTILFLSLGLLVRTSGQVSLCHVSFMVIGVSAFSHLAVDHHWPWGFALLAAGLITVPIGALLAIPAIRLSGIYLALATFGFGLLLQYMFYTEKYMFGDQGVGLSVPQPQVRAIGLTGGDTSYYYLCLVLVVATTAVIVVINRSRLGRLLRALRDSPVGLATNGTSTNVTRVIVFCVSAFLAAIAGVLQAGAIGQVDGSYYQPITSLVYFTLVVIVLGGAPWYALVAAAGTAIVPSYFPSTNTANWLQLAFGATAILFAMAPTTAVAPPAWFRDAVDRVFRRATTEAVTAGVEPSAVSVERPAQVSLAVADLRVTFGGVVAVDGARVTATTGRITGLMGPNGAGKTTLFNACSGLNRPAGGTMTFGGASLLGKSAARRARLGIGRTFQQMELFDSLTVQENAALGAEAGHAGANFLRHLVSSPVTTRRVRERALDAMRACDLLELAGRTVGSLSTGQRRLVELARCLAGPYDILLLDEPSSGLDRVETARFGELLLRVVRERGVGILLVEHDMALVSDVCDYVYVLDFGVPIFDGGTAEAMASPVVRAAYLGESDTAEPAEVGPVESEAGR
jgi:ABC-type branched-subunit amino acid transport system ATPase component/branched-subunit amino acid ABC-type transport system permease component